MVIFHSELLNYQRVLHHSNEQPHLAHLVLALSVKMLLREVIGALLRCSQPEISARDGVPLRMVGHVAQKKNLQIVSMLF